MTKSPTSGESRNDELGELLSNAIKKMNKGGHAPRVRVMPPKIEKGARRIKDPAFAMSVTAHCREVISSFALRPSLRLMPHAQDAAGVLLMLASGQIPSVVVDTAMFAGSPRQIPGQDQIRMRITLGTPIIDVEKEMTSTVLSFDELWLSMSAVLGRTPSRVFEKSDGGHRSRSAFSVGCKRLFISKGINLTPKMIDTGLIGAFLAAGLSTEEIAKSVGQAQPHNIVRRAGDFFEEEVAQKFADALDDDGENNDI